VSERVLIIAEIGECWNGDFNQAKKLIEVAASAGCDYAKFQTLDREGIAEDDPEREWFLSIALDADQLRELRDHATRNRIGFLVTPEKRKQAEMLAALGCQEVKIASSCLVDDDLLTFVNGNFRRVFISTGLAELPEIDHAVRQLASVPELYIFHCIAEYPTGPLLDERGLAPLRDEDVHMQMMQMLAERYPHARVGYSDHTVGLLAPIVAAAAGARAIEKHITLDRETPVRNFQNKGRYLGTDHVLSLEPAELAEMVRTIRLIEAMLGDRQWRRSAGELKLREFLRSRFHQDEPSAG
jgi:N,N'-diacetyllegionaminate synthase